MILLVVGDYYGTCLVGGQDENVVVTTMVIIVGFQNNNVMMTIINYLLSGHDVDVVVHLGG